MISRQDYEKRLADAFQASGAKGIEVIDTLLREHIWFGLQNYRELDAEAKKQVDDMVGLVLESAKKGAEVLEDGEKKREALRTIAQMENRHVSVKVVFEGLGQPREEREEYVKVAEAGVLEILQAAADVMYDTRNIRPRGRESFLVAALFVGGIDDTLCATRHLGRGLASQAATLLRAAQEKREVAELFLVRPELIDVWMDEEQRWKELRPAKVRRLLGRKGTDLPYKYLSEAGAHPTLMSIKGRAAIRSGADAEGATPKLNLWIGGQMLPWAIVPLCMGVLAESYLILLTAIKWMQLTSCVPENERRVQRAEELFAEFNASHAIPRLREMGMSDEDVAEILSAREGDDEADL